MDEKRGRNEGQCLSFLLSEASQRHEAIMWRVYVCGCVCACGVHVARARVSVCSPLCARVCGYAYEKGNQRDNCAVERASGGVVEQRRSGVGRPLPVARSLLQPRDSRKKGKEGRNGNGRAETAVEEKERWS